MRPFSFGVSVLLIFLISRGRAAPALTSSTSCQAAGGEDQDSLAITCNTDSGSKSLPFSNLVQAVNGLTVFNINASDDVNVDSANVESLTYTGNSAEIPDGAFSAFKNLRELIIDFSQASVGDDGTSVNPPPVNLKANAFKGLESNLKRLDLIGVNLINAGGFPNAIRGLSALESLKLEDCSLKGQVSGKDLQNLKNLRRLEISGSPDLSVSDDIFANNADNLERAAFTSVQMKTLPKSVASLKSLREFQAQKTGLTSLPATFQSSGSTLKELRLSDNSIANIDPGAFKGLSALTVLILSQNQISTLPAGLFDDLVSLENLQLNGNRLSSSGVQNSFSKLKTLKQLALGDNQLDSITPGTLAGIESSVTVLYFSGNQIKSIKGTSKLTQSPQLVLSSNGIDSLVPDTFESGSTFSELLIDSNPITLIKSGAFKNIDVGPAFSIDDTALTEFDLSSISGMKSVQNLTIENNADLRTLKISSDSDVPSTLKFIKFENNGKFVLSDSDGKLASYLKKSGVRLIFSNRAFCHCQLGWLRKLTGDRKTIVMFASTNEDTGEQTPAQCCNMDDGTTVDDFLSDKIYTQQCAGQKEKAPVTDDDYCY